MMAVDTLSWFAFEKSRFCTQRLNNNQMILLKNETFCDLIYLSLECWDVS